MRTSGTRCASKHDMTDDYAHGAYLWKPAFEVALAETNPEHRRKLLVEAQEAILQRARALEDEGGSDTECMALEEAASSLRELKLSTQADGASKKQESGNAETI